MKNYNEYIWFLFDPKRTNRSFGFRTYTDNKHKECGYVVGKDIKSGAPIYKKWKFDLDNKRTIRVHVDEEDLNGVKAVDFLKNSPECYGSPNGAYLADGTQIDYYYKIVDDEGDADKAADILVTKALAITKAANVKGQEFIDLCAMISVFNQKEGVMRHKLIDYAQNFPDKFLAVLDDPSRKVRSIVRRAVDSHIFHKDGPVIKWENKIIGADEDTAVATLLRDEDLMNTVNEVIKKLS